ncbi:over compensating males isoform X2 [Anticarsia gemmatalis]|uniref:over compensating males isoform X2 n=1 Tax=Anticarsia gemmatalis TaxID=129554 RepID=UPI003F769778
MEPASKVFRSDIIRTGNHLKNNLYELTTIKPAKPLVYKDKKQYTCEFVPKTDKIYQPKRRPRTKVKTVRDIRRLFENDIYAYLPSDLELQQNVLLKKIRGGSAKNEETIKVAKKLLQTDNPVSRSTWQMLVNINPDHHLHPRQYVIWNGNLIQVNGSMGGNNKLIYKYDLAQTRIAPQIKGKVSKTNVAKKKKGLLRNSLAIKFKPGPLRKKKFLDDSHQKNHGDIELVDLPKVGLVVEPAYNKVLEPSVMHLLNNFCNEDGKISGKYAEFAVSALGKIEKSNFKIIDNKPITFTLNYKYGQHRILMRRDLENISSTSNTVTATSSHNDENKDQPTITPVVKDMMEKILDAVEISIDQDKMFNICEEVNESTLKEPYPKMPNANANPKEKPKKKYCELGRLDVTVIQLPESSTTATTENCRNPSCSFGCVCDSLKGTYNFKQHCGREECMFNCKCDFSKYSRTYSVVDTDLISGIINIEDEINTRLAKEEQKFHQTVIVTGEKNILFKSEKRNWKSSKKYESFYKNMCLKNVNKKKRVLSVSVVKLNSKNIKPWCMVHNLYKCFCKGKFTETDALYLQNLAKEPANKDTVIVHESAADNTQNQLKTGAPTKQNARDVKCLRHREIPSNPSCNSEIQEINTDRNALSETRVLRSSNESSMRTSLRSRGNKSTSESSEDLSPAHSTCSRVNAYTGRKYSNAQYKYKNEKIKYEERHAQRLQQKQQNVSNVIELDNETENNTTIEHNPENNLEHQGSNSSADNSDSEITESSTIPTDQERECIDESINDRNFLKYITNHNGSRPSVGEMSKGFIPSDQIVSWVEAHYQTYKQTIDQGLLKTSLDPPKAGRIAMYSWEFILSRYREKKNLFFISKRVPYRIFMGVSARNPFFRFCININEIRFADLYKYPQTVKNLLTNATDLKDHFCILRGSSDCWEIVGAVSKVKPGEDNDESSDIEFNPDGDASDEYEQNESDNRTERPGEQFAIENQTLSCSNEAESSKWFILIVENDFREIRFLTKGFFIKYESIVKAINVARISRKTVRLSSQKCVDENSVPTFGVYAIPDVQEYCVFIGPYELNEPLGITTFKSVLDYGKPKQTRGVWININKVDNLKVIESPMSFMPLAGSVTIPLENHVCDNVIESNTSSPEKNVSHDLVESQQRTRNLMDKKSIKPIKICKTNGFYHLATDGQLKKISIQGQQKILITTPLNSTLVNDVTNKKAVDPIPISSASIIKNVVSPPKPDGATKGELPQIKISAVYSQRESSPLNKTEKMFILKPEEINRKLLTQKYPKVNLLAPNASCGEFSTSENMDTDPANDNILVISDDEEDVLRADNGIEQWRDILIQCTNVSDLGWIWGRQMCKSLLISFRVPGGRYSKFCTEQEAFEKLNLELSKIINPSKPFNLNWRVVDSIDEIDGEIPIMDVVRLRKLELLDLKDDVNEEYLEENLLDSDPSSSTC